MVVSLFLVLFITYFRNGKAVIKNVNLQSEVTELFGLPLIIKFSTVGKILI